MSPATINNLSLHLNWLLREKPSVPPPAPEISVSSASSVNDASAPVSSATLPATSFSAVAVRSPPRQAVRLGEEGDMARLRAGPTTSASKPKLLSAGARDENDLHSSKKLVIASPTCSPTSRNRVTPASRSLAAALHMGHVASVDLTGDDSPTTSIRKKRKSEEMANAFSPSQHRKAPKAARISDTADDDDEFTAIDDIYPVEPPPPYATIPPAPRSPFAQHRPSQSNHFLHRPPQHAGPTDEEIEEAMAYEEEAAATLQPVALPKASNARAVNRHVTSEGYKSGVIMDTDDDSTPEKSLSTQAPMASTCQLIEDEKAMIEKVLSLTDTAIAIVASRFEREMKDLAAEQIRYLDMHDEQSADLISKLRVIKGQSDALEKLVSIRALHTKHSAEKAELARIMTDAIVEGIELSMHDQANNIKLKQLIEQHKQDMLQLLRVQGPYGPLSSLLISSARPNVVVKSTQAAPGLVQSREMIPESSLISSASRVKQTQANPRYSPRKNAFAGAAWGTTADEPLFQPSQSRTLQQTANADIRSYLPHSRMTMEYAETSRDLHQSMDHGAREAMGPMSASRLNKRPTERRDIPAPPRFEKQSVSAIFTEDDFEDDEDLFANNMGTPPQQVCADEDEYGYEDDDLLEAEDFVPYPAVRSQLTTTPRNSNQNPFVNNKSAKKHSTALDGPLMQYSWSKEVKVQLKDTFQLKGFRPNQLEAVNATLAGKDVFVLMPTGGGKSLCYQLPAVVASGKTKGITIVVSPLLSLMEDQVQHLQKLKVQAYCYNGEMSQEQRDMIWSALQEPRPEEFIRILYVTPELLSKSSGIVKAFERIHKNGLLARLVIDEAHCVSQWGHDFRPDYKQLGDFRRRFTGVPVMALTATATENVKLDVIHNLGIKGCEMYKQSFNRPNLHYTVLKKEKGVVNHMAELIQQNYKKQCGIIYCLSRKTCEKVAEDLAKKHGISAHHYHAGMEPADKKEVQRKWQEGRIHVIVATIAFGMGIDKSNVRFVMHHTLPKSLEGYYQETGRAGRDGRVSGCYLYYNYGDTNSLKRQINEGDGSAEQKARQHRMLNDVIGYCDNRVDCRRAQVLRYFSESFNKQDCNDTCDNCSSKATFVEQDFTSLASAACRLVRALGSRGREHSSKVTMRTCIMLLSDKKIKDISSDLYNLDGAREAKDVEIGEVERLFHRLARDGAILEYSEMNRAGFPVDYIKPGRNIEQFIRSQRPVTLKIRVSPNKRTGVSAATKKKVKPKKRTSDEVSRNDFASTYVSSPVREVSKPHKRMKQALIQDEAEGDSDSSDAFEAPVELHANGYARDAFVVDDDEDEDYTEDDEEPPIIQRKQTKATRAAKSRKLGPPIAGNPLMDNLDSDRREFVDSFLANARPLCSTIMDRKGLRDRPFSDTVLTKMAVNNVKTKDQMRCIDGVRPEMVSEYGNQFLNCLSMVRNLFADEGRDFEAKPHDPNHAVVVNLCSDDENAGPADLDDTEDEAEEGDDGPSEYFAQSSSFRNAPATANATSEKARAWQEQMNAYAREQTVSKRSTSAMSTGFSKRSPKRNFSKQYFAKQGAITKSKKRKSSEGSGARSRNAGGASRTGGGGRSRGGIGLMPT